VGSPLIDTREIHKEKAERWRTWLTSPNPPPHPGTPATSPQYLLLTRVEKGRIPVR